MKLDILKQTLAALAILGATCCHQVFASPIIWTTGPNFDGPNGFEAIGTGGTLVEAINLTNTSTGDLTVDPGGLNITFTPRSDILSGTAFTTQNFNSTTDAAWNAIILNVDFRPTGGNFTQFNLVSLMIDKTYRIQLFSFDNRSGQGTEVTKFSDGLGNDSASFTKGSATSIFGTFTADAATQAIRLVDDDDQILNAYVLHQLPTPSALALMLLGIGILFKQRRWFT